jgi:hypothetical protein
MKTIEVNVPVSAQSLPYYDFLVKNYQSLATPGRPIKFFAYSLDGCVASEGVTVFCKNGGVGSGGHANAIADIVAAQRQCSIKIIADSDTVMLLRSWDVMLERLHEMFHVVGTTYEDIGGFSSGNGPVQTYKGRPNLTWLSLAPNVELTGFDPSPTASPGRLR